MWLRDPIPIEISKVASVIIGLQVLDDFTEKPIDLTGYSVSCRVAIADGEYIVGNPSVAIVNAVSGFIDVNFNGKAMAAIGDQAGSTNLSYQIKAMGSDGIDIILMRGPLILTPGIQ